MNVRRAYSITFYFLFFAAVAFLMPNFILYYQGLGFSGIQIGLIAGMAPLITMVGAPFWTGLADAKRIHKLIMSLALLMSVLLACIFPLVSGLLPVILLVGVYSFFTSPLLSLGDSATMTMLAGAKEMYGRMRLGGTIGFGLAAILAGIILQSYGIQWAFWGFAFLMFLAFFVSLKFKYETRVADGSIKWDLHWVLTDRRWLFFLILAFFGGLAFTTINSYLFPYMEELGFSKTTMGIALTITTLGELPILFFSNRLIKRFGAYGLFLLGVTITGMRLLLYAIFNTTAGILIFQLLNGMTFPLMWVAGVSYADEKAPPGMKSTAQGLFGAMLIGIGSATGGFLGGIMLGSIGGRWMYFILGSLVLVCVGLITLVERAKRLDPARDEI